MLSQIYKEKISKLYRTLGLLIVRKYRDWSRQKLEPEWETGRSRLLCNKSQKCTSQICKGIPSSLYWYFLPQFRNDLFVNYAIILLPVHMIFQLRPPEGSSFFIHIKISIPTSIPGLEHVENIWVIRSSYGNGLSIEGCQEGAWWTCTQETAVVRYSICQLVWKLAIQGKTISLQSYRSIVDINSHYPGSGFISIYNNLLPAVELHGHSI